MDDNLNMPYVYAITDGTSIKIGVARRPHKRVKALSTGNSSKLRLLGYFPGGFEYEKQLHNRFSKDRVKGEWFRPSSEVLDFLNENINDKFIVVVRDKVLVYPKMSG